jgi:hypothetical protein
LNSVKYNSPQARIDEANNMRSINETVAYIAYRLYACGNLISEDLFEEYDNMQPYYDDYCQTAVPLDIEGEDAVRAYFDDAMDHEAVVYHTKDDCNNS